MTFSAWETRVLAILIGVTATTPIAADLRLDQERVLRVLDRDGETAFFRELEEVMYIGERSARYDTGSDSFIVRVDDGGVFLWLDHGSRSYAEVSLPIKLEDLLTETEEECLRSFPDALASVKLTGERRSIGRWSTQRLRIESRPESRLQFEDDRWITHDLPVDLGPYLLLVRSTAALNPSTRGWIEALTAAGGIAVESKTSMPVRGRTRVFSTRLKSVGEVASDEARYLPPAGYSRVPRPPLDIECVGGEPAGR